MTARNRNPRGDRPGIVGIALLAVLALGVACTANDGAKETTAAANASPSDPSTASGVNGHGSKSGATDGSPSTSEGSSAAPDSGAPVAIQSPLIKKDDGKPGPPPIKFPYKNEVPIDSVVEPSCVARGQKITLKVQTKPKAGIAYQAMYADGNAGTAPPFGKGYGGNDKGYSSDGGAFESSWVLSADAPPGPARVDVFVGYSGKWGYDHPHFAVSDSDGNCPEKWLSQGNGGKK